MFLLELKNILDMLQLENNELQALKLQHDQKMSELEKIHVEVLEVINKGISLVANHTVSIRTVESPFIFFRRNWSWRTCSRQPCDGKGRWSARSSSWRGTGERLSGSLPRPEHCSCVLSLCANKRRILRRNVTVGRRRWHRPNGESRNK